MDARLTYCADRDHHKKQSATEVQEEDNHGQVDDHLQDLSAPLPIFIPEETFDAAIVSGPFMQRRFSIDADYLEIHCHHCRLQQRTKDPGSPSVLPLKEDVKKSRKHW